MSYKMFLRKYIDAGRWNNAVVMLESCWVQTEIRVIQSCWNYAQPVNTKGGSITVPLTSCLTGLD